MTELLLILAFIGCLSALDSKTRIGKKIRTVVGISEVSFNRIHRIYVRALGVLIAITVLLFGLLYYAAIDTYSFYYRLFYGPFILFFVLFILRVVNVFHAYMSRETLIILLERANILFLYCIVFFVLAALLSDSLITTKKFNTIYENVKAEKFVKEIYRLEQDKLIEHKKSYQKEMRFTASFNQAAVLRQFLGFKIDLSPKPDSSKHSTYINHVKQLYYQTNLPSILILDSVYKYKAEQYNSYHFNVMDYMLKAAPALLYNYSVYTFDGYYTSLSIFTKLIILSLKNKLTEWTGWLTGILIIGLGVFLSMTITHKIILYTKRDAERQNISIEMENITFVFVGFLSTIISAILYAISHF